jgi:hypothetical protein
MFFENDAWYDNPHYICENGHIASFKLKSEGLGRDACLTCCGTLNAWKPGVDWVIVGGESGHGARPMHPLWAESLRDQCQAVGVPFLFKQWGEWGPTEAIYAMYPGKAVIPARLGYKLHDFTPGLIKRSMDDVENEHIIAWKLGKHIAGRQLAGRTWDEVPAGKEVARAH